MSQERCGHACKGRCNPRQPCWDCRLSARSRAVLDAIQRWLQIEWEWFITLTFPAAVPSELADVIFWAFINSLEKLYRANVCVVVGKESNSRTQGVSVPFHFHLVIKSAVTIPDDVIKSVWRNEVAAHSLSECRNDSIVVQSFKKGKRGLEYSLKSMSNDDGHWDAWNVDLFLPEQRWQAPPNCRARRRRRRAALQAWRF